jgi:hypothetical protein
MNVLYRKSGASGYIVADQRSAGGGTSAIDDLTPSVTYEIAVQAFSAFGVGSNIISGGTQVAPSNTTAPTAPTSGSVNKNAVTILSWDVSSIYFGSRAQWTFSTDQKRVAYYEIKSTTSPADTSTDFSWFSTIGVAGVYQTTENFFDYYRATPANGHVHVRAIDLNGNASAWLSCGNLVTAAIAMGGTMALQSSTNVTTTGIKTGGGASTRQINVEYKDSVVVTLAGVSSTETFNVDITNRGFSVKPDSGLAQCSSDENLSAAYDFDAAGNSGTSAVVRVTTIDGANIGAGNYRFSVEFTDYT